MKKILLVSGINRQVGSYLAQKLIISKIKVYGLIK